MKSHEFMQHHQLETFARFLEEHPGFAPTLVDEDALVCSSEIGGSHVSIAEMERMIAGQKAIGPAASRFLVGSPRSDSASCVLCIQHAPSAHFLSGPRSLLLFCTPFTVPSVMLPIGL